jgi:3-oxoadipate enol-lactonase
VSVANDERTTIRGVELAHRVTRVPGRPWFVWGHGLTSSMAGDDELGLIDWTHVTGAASVVRYDARGHGSSGSSRDLGGYHWRSLAVDQLALADHLGLDRYVAGGASMGCATALYAALAAPHRVMALVLVIPPTAWETRAAQIEGYELSARLVEAGEIDLLLAGAAERPPPDPFVGEPQWRDRFERMARSTAPDRLARVFRGAGATDLPPRETLTSISVPTVVLAWTGDAGHPVSTAEQVVELIPGARLHVASTLEQLAGWTDVVVELIDAVADASMP